MTVGSTSHARRRRASWALARTVLVLGGLGFVSASLAAACLDHYDESYGCEVTPTVGTGTATADCGAGDAGEAGVAIGSGSGAF